MSFDERNCAICPNCGGPAQKCFTTSDQPLDVKVTGDRYNGVQVKKDLNKTMEQRAKDHYDEEGSAEIREKWGADCIVENKNPKKKQVVTK
jgi:hypothetical protein